MRPILASMLLAGCAVTPRYVLPPAPALEKVPPIDWKAAGDEATGLLQQYLRIDTTNPPGNEIRGVKFLADVLERNGIPSKTFEYAPGRASLVARLKGSGEDEPLCLVSHVDVVTADASKWPKETGPLSGAIDSHGVLWGRGALDMKGMGIMELETMLVLARAHVPLRRDVVLVAVADEEVDNDGMRDLVTHHWDELGCGEAVNEGGIGLEDLMFEGQTVFAISNAEKGIAWVRMTAHGKAGHGSTPVPGRAPEHLVRALDRLRAREAEPRIVPELYSLLRAAGDGEGGLTGFVLARPFLVDHLVRGRLESNPATLAGITDTVQVTGFSGALEPNVVPSEVSAVLDCRLLPGSTPATMLAELGRLVDDPAISFTLLEGDDANGSPLDDPFYAALVRAAKAEYPKAAVGPVLSPGYTDSILLRPKGVHAYGFVPFVVSKEEAATMHGDDERVSIENLHRGVRMLFSAVAEVSLARTR